MALVALPVPTPTSYSVPLRRVVLVSTCQQSSGCERQSHGSLYHVVWILAKLLRAAGIRTNLHTAIMG